MDVYISNCAQVSCYNGCVVLRIFVSYLMLALSENVTCKDCYRGGRKS